MMDNNCLSRLFRVEVECFGQLNIDARRIQQLKELRLILKIRTCGVTEAEPRPLIALAEKLVQVLRVATGDAQLFANSFVPQFRQGLGAFNTQSVKVEIVGVVVAFEKLL